MTFHPSNVRIARYTVESEDAGEHADMGYELAETDEAQARFPALASAIMAAPYDSEMRARLGLELAWAILLDAATTRAEARDLAIQWQAWASEQAPSYGELVAWQARLEAVAHKFDLTDEFRENGLI